MIQIALIIAMGALQVFVVRFFFQVSTALYQRLLRLTVNVASRERERVMSKLHELMNWFYIFTRRRISKIVVVLGCVQYWNIWEYPT